MKFKGHLEHLRQRSKVDCCRPDRRAPSAGIGGRNGTDLTDTIQTWRGMYGNHSRGPWMAEVERDGMRHSARGQTEDEARGGSWTL